jgi:hypothetical protein
VKSLRTSYRRYIFQVLTGLVLLATWEWAYQPAAHSIALAHAKITAHELAIKEYETAIANRAYYEKLKTETLKELNSINVEPTMSKTEATFIREVGTIAKANGVEWRAIRPNAVSRSASSPVAVPTASASPAPQLIPMPNVLALNNNGTAASPTPNPFPNGIVDSKSLVVTFRGRNAGVFKAMRALGDGRVLTTANAAGFSVENTPNGPQVNAQIGVVIERVNVSEAMLFPPTILATPSAAASSPARPASTPTPFVPPTTAPGGASVRT